jgi:transaldolase
MNPRTRALHTLGQSLWLDHISRRLLNSGALARYIGELSVTGLTSNPTIFEHAIGNDDSYDDVIRELAAQGLSSEDIFFALALSDLSRAADLLRAIHDASHGVDGWVSLEVSPLLAHDTANTIKAARQLHARAGRPNLFIKIPGTPEGLPAIEQSIADGIPVNVTLLFSREHYLAAAEAYMRGVERRLAAGQNPGIDSVASLFISRWDTAAADKVPAAFRNRLGIAMAMRTYKVYRELLTSARWQKLAAAGARPQRLLWASTGTKDPAASDVLYVEALAAPDTINTMPEKTLFAFADHGKTDQVLPEDGGYAEVVLAEFNDEGLNDEALAAELQRQGTAAFTKSWSELMYRIAAKSEQLAKVRHG